MMWHEDIPLDYRNAIVTGDARELARALPDESVDLIFTDPVYWQIDDYNWLAETAARVLKPGGSVVAQVGTHFRYEAETAMRKSSLEACPLLVEIFNGGLQQNWKHRSIIGWKPYIWMTKGKRQGKWIVDRHMGGRQAKHIHEWGDSEPFYVLYIHDLCPTDGTVFDPFTGGGTVPAVCKLLNRNYIAFEIDPATAARARARVEATQAMHPVFLEEQQVLL